MSEEKTVPVWEPKKKLAVQKKLADLLRAAIESVQKAIAREQERLDKTKPR
jgi:hypothetical protein